MAFLFIHQHTPVFDPKPEHAGRKQWLPEDTPTICHRTSLILLTSPFFLALACIFFLYSGCCFVLLFFFFSSNFTLWAEKGKTKTTHECVAYFPSLHSSFMRSQKEQHGLHLPRFPSAVTFLKQNVTDIKHTDIFFFTNMKVVYLLIYLF